MLITDQAQDITDAFDQAAQGNFQPRTPRSSGAYYILKSRFIFQGISLNIWVFIILNRRGHIHAINIESIFAPSNNDQASKA